MIDALLFYRVVGETQYFSWSISLLYFNVAYDRLNIWYEYLFLGSVNKSY